MSLPNQVTVDPAVDRNFRDLDERLDKAIISTVERLKVIRGTVNTAGSGSITVGSGFTISTRTGTGDVTLAFTAAFSATPSVMLTSNNWAAIWVSPSTTGVRIQNFKTTDGSAIDGSVSFIAIGPA